VISVPWTKLTLKILTVAGVFVICAGLRFGHEFFVPLALSILLSLILSPLVTLGERIRLPRPVSAIIIAVMFLGMLGVAGFFIAGQASSLARKLPEYQSNAMAKLAKIQVPFAQWLKQFNEAMSDLETGSGRNPRPEDVRPGVAREPVKVEVMEGAPRPFHVASIVVGPIFSMAGSIALVLLLVIFFLIYEPEIRDRIIRLAGDAQVNMTTQTMTEATLGVSSYLLSQSLVNISCGLLLGVGLYAFGVPAAFLWGALAGVLRFIPYLGPIIGASVPVLMSFGAFPGWTRSLLIAGFFATLELLVGNVVEPLVYGKRTGLSPLAVVLAAVFWAWMWGVVGLILAVPLTLCLVSIGKYVPSLGFLTIALGDEPALEPKVQVYHRLLGRHQEQAAELLEKELAAGKPLAEFYDRVVLPVLQMAQTDLQHGKLDEEKAAALFASIREIVDDVADSARLERDKKAVPSGADPGVEPCKATILCLPASDRTDELSAHMLAQVLALRGCQAKALSVEKMAGEVMDLVKAEGADLVVICALPPTNLLRARYLYKRLRRRFEEMPIVEGLLGSADARRIEARIAPDGKATIISSFVEADKAIPEIAREAAMRSRLRNGVP